MRISLQYITHPSLLAGAMALGATTAGCQKLIYPAPSTIETVAVSTPEIDRPGSPPPTAYATFDEVWNTVAERHFDPEYNGVDWEAVRLELRPEIEQTRTESDVRMVLNEMLSRLGQSHFVIMPGDSPSESMPVEGTIELEVDAVDSEPSSTTDTDDQAPAMDASDESDESPQSDEPGSSGLRLGFVGEDIGVVRVNEGGPADRAGVQPGWMVTSVNNQPLDPMARRFVAAMKESDSSLIPGQATMVLDAMVTDTSGDTMRFEFVDFDGNPVEETLVLEPLDAEVVKFGLLPEMPTIFESHWISPEEMTAMGIEFDAADPPRIGYIEFNVWMFPIMAALAEAVDEFRDADGVIVDLRRNPGGLGGLAMGAAGHFIGDPVSLGTMMTRENTLEFMVNPQRATMDGRLVEPFAGPLVLLVDPGTASTSEIFGAGLQQLDRAHVVGRQSMGAALPAMTKELPNGDVFMFAIANFIGPDNESVEVTGVVPDQPVVLDQARLRAEKDPDLKTALDWILKENSR